MSKNLEELFGLRGKVAFVTGAGGGIGGEVADALASAGASVVCADIDAAAAARTAEAVAARYGTRAHAVAIDVTSEDSVAAAMNEARRKLGAIDVLANMAGVPHMPAAPHDMPLADWHRVMNVNVTGVLLCCREALRGMVQTGVGKIINISSTVGQRSSASGTTIGMSAAKGAINAITREIAIAYAQAGIRANALAPSHVRTNIAAQLFPGEDYDTVAKKVFGHAHKEIPVGRIAEPRDLRGAAIFLASPASDYMTGQIVYVDGGKMAR